MSNIINSLLIEPVVRHARRFSTPEPRPSHGASPPPGGTAGTSHTGQPNTLTNNLSTSSLQPRVVPDVGARSTSDDHEISTIDQQDLLVARQTSFPRLLPLDDVQSGHVLTESPPSSPDPSLSIQHELISSLAAHTSADDGTVTSGASIRSLPLEQAPSRSWNPSYSSVPGRFRIRDDTSSANTGRSSLDSASQRASADEPRSDAAMSGGNMSGMLPADDGMRSLREKMHSIHDMALSTEDKAKKMHALMVSDYTAFRQQQVKDVAQQSNWRPRKVSMPKDDTRSRSASPALSSDANKAVFDVRPEDVETSFWPHAVPAEATTPDEDGNATENEPIFGCKHYMRNIKVQCSDCLRWYTCRHCHDELEDHSLVRKHIRYMLCMYCGHPQKANDHCEECEEEAATYYCEICKLWDNDASKSIYHCDDCGICRKGEGIGKDYVHCKKCNVCVSINHAYDHRCVERATECDCPICGDYMFSSLAAVVAMRCGHYIHRKCYDAYMQTSYKCPICSRSAVNMELQWRKMDLCLESQPMPDSYRDTQAWIICNDCTMKSCVPFHWLGNKCRFCDSYNTNQDKVVNSDEPLEPQTEERRAAQAVQAAQANGTIPEGLAPDLLPSTMPLGRPRQHTEPPRAHAQELLAQATIPSASRMQILPSPATQMSTSPSYRQRQDDRSPPRRSSDPINSRRSEIALTPSQPLPISVNSQSNIDIARMTSAAASGAASVQPSCSDDESAASDAESEDSTTFWGSSISPPIISLMPSGWTSPRLFASSPASAPADIDADHVSDPSVLSSWGINPGTWRLNSPNFFGSASSPPAEAADLDVEEEGADGANSGVFPTSWHPSQWHISSPHEYFFGSSNTAQPPPGVDAVNPGHEETVATATLPSFPTGWHPSHWRLSSPQFFSGDPETIDEGVGDAVRAGVKLDPAIGKSEDANVMAENEGGLWNLSIRPRFLTERFGSFSSGGGVPLPWARSEEAKSDERAGSGQSESTGDEEEDNADSEGEEEQGEPEGDDDEEDELDLIGHR